MFPLLLLGHDKRNAASNSTGDNSAKSGLKGVLSQATSFSVPVRRAIMTQQSPSKTGAQHGDDSPAQFNVPDAVFSRTPEGRA